jgi:hypothetical protein
MNPRLAPQLDALELKTLKYGESRTSESFVRGGEVFEEARLACKWSKEQAAAHYGVSQSLLTRQVANQDNQHLSFQRICEMPAEFRREIGLRLLREVGAVEEEHVFRIRRAG